MGYILHILKLHLIHFFLESLHLLALLLCQGLIIGFPFIQITEQENKLCGTSTVNKQVVQGLEQQKGTNIQPLYKVISIGAVLTREKSMQYVSWLMKSCHTNTLN